MSARRSPPSSGSPRRARPGRPRSSRNWGDFTRSFGGFVSGYATPLSVYGYFDNGGGRAYIVRVNSDGGAATPVALLPASSDASLKSPPGAGARCGRRRERRDGRGQRAAEDTFKLTVRGPAGAVEEFDNVSLKKGKGNVLTEVKSRSKLIILEEVSTEGSLVERRPADGTYALAAAEAAPPKSRREPSPATSPSGPASPASRRSTK